MAEARSRASLPQHLQVLGSTTTLLLRRVPSGPAGGRAYALVDVAAVRGDEPLAAARATLASAAGDVVLTALTVLPRWRGRGLGGRLLTEVIDELRADGVLRVWAQMSYGGHDPGVGIACHRLFRRRGFRPSDAPPGWQSHFGADWVVLEL